MSNSPEDYQPWWRVAPWPVWAFGLLLAVLVTLPTVAGMARRPDGWVFTGAPAVPGMQWTITFRWRACGRAMSRLGLVCCPSRTKTTAQFRSSGFYVALSVIGRVLR